MATLVSKAAYAKLHGKSPQAAAKWQAKGCLVFIDGKVHVERSDERMQHAALGRYAVGSIAAGNSQPNPSTVNRSGEVDDHGDGDARSIQSLEDFVSQLLNGNYADLGTASVVKENALALKRVLEARREAGQLIDLGTAETALFEAGRQAREAWMNFPSRIGPLMAAQLDINSDRLVEVLSEHVHQQLADLGEPDAEFADPSQAQPGLSAGHDATAQDQHTGLG